MVTERITVKSPVRLQRTDGKSPTTIYYQKLHIYTCRRGANFKTIGGLLNIHNPKHEENEVHQAGLDLHFTHILPISSIFSKTKRSRNFSVFDDNEAINSSPTRC